MISATGARKLSKKASKMEMVESKIKEVAKKGEREVKIRTFFYGEEKNFQKSQAIKWMKMIEAVIQKYHGKGKAELYWFRFFYL